MLSLMAVGLLGVVFSLLGFLVWLPLRLFRIRRGRLIAKSALISWLISLPLFFFLAAPILASALIFNAGTRPMDFDLKQTPETFQRHFQAVRFSSRDGVELSGWYLEGDPHRPAITLSHGLFRNRFEMLERGCGLNAKGYPVLLFDLRGHRIQRSDPGSSPVTLGYQERQDVQGAVDFLRSRRSNPDVVLMGVSMGAVACILAAPEIEPPVSAVIADSPFLNLHETVTRHAWLILKLPSFPFSNIFCWNLGRLAGFDAAQHDTAAALRRIPQMPILLIYGSDDDRMPEETARAVFQSVQSPRKDLAFFEDAGHGGAYAKHPKRYMQTVLDFLQPPAQP